MEWNISSVERNHQPRNLYPEKLSLKSEEEIKPFSEKIARQFVACKLGLQELLREILYREGNNIGEELTST